MNQAVLNKRTGEILWRSAYGEDEITPVENDFDWDNCVDIPHKNDLDLGKPLILEFVEKNLPNKTVLVDNYFQHRGAYSNFKALLETEGLLQQWYNFENTRQDEALRQWCLDNEIEYED
jgi:hypothetical protein